MPWFEIQHQASQSDPLKDVKPNPTVLTRMHRLVIDCLSGPNSRALEPWFLRKRRAAPSVLHLHFYAKQPMSWVSPPAHDASHHQG